LEKAAKKATKAENYQQRNLDKADRNLLDMDQDMRDSNTLKGKLKEDKQHLAHDLKMADREMDLVDANLRREQMSDPVGMKIIQSKPILGKRKTDSSASQQKKPRIYDETEEIIAREKLEADLKFKQDRSDKRSRAREQKILQDAKAQRKKMEEWSASEWETTMGLHLSPSIDFRTTVGKHKPAQKKVSSALAMKNTVPQWDAIKSAGENRLKNILESGQKAQQELDRVMGKTRVASATQLKVLKTDLMPHENSLPARHRSAIAMKFVPQMKVKYPSAGWPDTWNPNDDLKYSQSMSSKMKQIAAQAAKGKFVLSPENNLLLLEVIGYPQAVRASVKKRINKAAKIVGELQKEYIKEAANITEATLAAKVRAKQDKIDEKKSKVQRLKNRPAEAKRGRSQSPAEAKRGRSQSPKPRLPRNRSQSRSRDRSPTPPRMPKKDPRASSPKPRKPKLPRTESRIVDSRPSGKKRRIVI
jgi:hypothetical protein